MGQRARHNVSNVVPIDGGHRPSRSESLWPRRAMTDAVRSFDRLEHCADAMLQPGRLGIAGDIGDTQRSVVSFQVQLPVVQQWLDQLEHINVANWPDTDWVLTLGNARSTAVLDLNAVKKSLFRNPPGTGALDGRLAADIRRLSDALHGLRQLISQQCPETHSAP